MAAGHVSMLLTHVKSIHETCNKAQDFLVQVCRNKLISKHLPRFEIVIFVHGKGLRCADFPRFLETTLTNPSIVSPQNEEVSCTFNVFPLTHTRGVKVEKN